MKNLIRRILLYLLEKIKMRYDLHKQIDGEWRYFTYREYNGLMQVGDVLENIMFNNEVKSYRVVERLGTNNNPTIILRLVEDETIQPTHIETIDYSLIGRLRNLFRRK